MNKLKTLLMLIGILTLAACQSNPMIKKLEIKEMRAIAELATVESYFHNVAKSDNPSNKEWFEIWKKKNVHFWIEYDGVVSVGIDVSKLKMEVDTNVVTISLPEAVVLNARVNELTLTKDSFYYDEDSEKPSAKDEKEAFKQAQQNMINAAESNSALLMNARENAKELLENYVKTISEVTGIDYAVEWIYLENEE